MRPLREFTNLDDSFFWHERIWQTLLQKLLKADPQSIGVTFFFPSSGLTTSGGIDWRVFRHPKVFWLGRLDSEGRLIAPFAQTLDGSNVGLLGVRFDDDRVVRKYSLNPGEPNLAQRLIEPEAPSTFASPTKTLNYTLSDEKIPRLTLSEVLSPSFDLSRLQGKVILIGTSEIETHLLRTPLGDMNRAEMIALQVDNLLGDKFIRTPPPSLIIAILALVLVVSIWLMSAYPQSIAFVFMFWLATGWTAFSFWIFDTYNVWLPILAPVAQVVVAYVIFLGYQLTVKENEAWRLEQEKKYLSEIEQLKNNFMSLISHDLKTPIAKIQAICDRLLAQSPPTEIVESLQSLRQESAELHRYIQSILKMSRVESRNFEIHKEASDINEMIETVVEQLRPLAQQKNLRLELDLEPIFSIEVDHLLIQEVILNLVENAIKYTPEGGLVSIRSQEIESEVVFSVEDSGPGIPLRDQTKIFEKFYRSPEQEHTTKGTGLGLYLVKYFVELHGGKVFLESREGKGTRIGFRLPTEEESAQLKPNTTLSQEVNA